MACLGVHFALTKEEVDTLLSFKSDADRLFHIINVIEEDYMTHHTKLCAQTDKSWDAMHRLLSDGDLSYYDGPEPLRFTVIGGEPLYSESDYIMSLKTPEIVQALAEELPKITAEDFRNRYLAMDEEKYGFPKSDEDLGYTWSWFADVVRLYQTAAAENRFVLFTADQ